MSYLRIIQTAPTNPLRGSEVQPWTTRIVLCQKRFTSQSSASDQLHQDAIQPKPSLPRGEWILTLSLWNQFQRARSSKMVLKKRGSDVGSNGSNLIENLCVQFSAFHIFETAKTVLKMQASEERYVRMPKRFIISSCCGVNIPVSLRLCRLTSEYISAKNQQTKRRASSSNTSCTSWVSALHSETAKHNPWRVAWRDHPVAIPRTSCRHDLSNSHGYPEYQRRCDCNDPWTMVKWIRSLNPRCVAPKCLILPNGWQWEKGSYCKIIAQKAFQWVRH